MVLSREKSKGKPNSNRSGKCESTGILQPPKIGCHYPLSTDVLQNLLKRNSIEQGPLYIIEVLVQSPLPVIACQSGCTGP